MAIQFAQQGKDTQVTIVEVPPYSDVATPAFHTTTSSYARLTDTQNWFVQTLIEIVVKDGIVKTASTDLPNAELSGDSLIETTLPQLP